MSDSTAVSTHASYDGGHGEVPVRARVWCSAIMLPVACLFSLGQCSFTARPLLNDPGSGGARYVWLVFCTFAAFVIPFILLLRQRYPEPVFWACAVIIAVFPYAPMLELMAMGSALARGTGRNRTMRMLFAGTAVAVWAELRDALQPADASVWHLIFAKPHTGGNGEPIVMLASEGTVVATATIAALIETAVAVLIGLHIRSRAKLQAADAKAHAAQTKAADLQTDLANQRLADAIAAEAHDTLAHSLSLIALNASALRTEAGKLGAVPGADRICAIADDIRRQSAGALDEAHSVIDMLRNPQQAWEQLIASDETSLTRDSLDTLIGDARNSGTPINTWIDIRDLSDLDEQVSKIAYRALQEGLTNARRHAPQSPVSLEVTVGPATGVLVHVSNPLSPPPIRSAQTMASTRIPGQSRPMNASPSKTAHHGAGLVGLAQRARSVGGECRYGVDQRRMFHLDVRLPWRQSGPTPPRQHPDPHEAVPRTRDAPAQGI